jgi:hypothetical protein
MDRHKAEVLAEKAHVRRMGASTIPLEVRWVANNVVRIIDHENGAWTQWDTSAWRIRRVAESEATK